MEDKGPGVITKIWVVCFYYGLDETTGANLKIYLDGEEEPTINCNFFEFVKGESFVKPPLAMETRRAGNSYLPIPYAKSCPYLFDEFGGVSFNTNQGGWGYGGSATEEEYYKKVASLVNVVLKMYPFIGGYCYTQLTDVELEQNGLYYYDRRPKFDIQKLRDIFGKQPEKVGENEME